MCITNYSVWRSIGTSRQPCQKHRLPNKMRCQDHGNSGANPWLSERYFSMQIPRAATHSEEAIPCADVKPCGSTRDSAAKVEGGQDAEEWKNASSSNHAMCDPVACDDGTRPPAKDNCSNEQNLSQLPMV